MYPLKVEYFVCCIDGFHCIWIMEINVYIEVVVQAVCPLPFLCHMPELGFQLNWFASSF